jgi:GNAT superfamily N-acetyltransferase
MATARVQPANAPTYSWRGVFSNEEVHALHAEAFETRLYDESEWDWVELCRRHSLGWVAARVEHQLIGFANVLWDGLVHAFLEDVMVAAHGRHRGVGVGLIRTASDGARRAGCEYLHVGFAPDLQPFYIEACGFTEVGGGLMHLASE